MRTLFLSAVACLAMGFSANAATVDLGELPEGTTVVTGADFVDRFRFSIGSGFTIETAKSTVSLALSLFAILESELKPVDSSSGMHPVVTSATGGDFELVVVEAAGGAVSNEVEIAISPVPLPAGLPLMLAGLIGLGAVARRRR